MEPSDVELEEDPQHLVDILSRVTALLPLLLFVCFFLLLLLLLCNHSTSSCHAGFSLVHASLFTQGNRRRGTEVQTQLLTSVCWGQINCVKECVAKCVSTLSCFFFFFFFLCAVLVIEGWFHAPLVHCYPFAPWQGSRIMSDKQYSWGGAKVQQAQLACSKTECT